MPSSLEPDRPGPDLIEHELSEDCVCGPRPVPVVDPAGAVDWIYVHHSLDGREQREKEAH